MGTHHLQDGSVGLHDLRLTPTENSERALGGAFDPATDGAVDDGHPLRRRTCSDPMQFCQSNGGVMKKQFIPPPESDPVFVPSFYLMQRLLFFWPGPFAQASLCTT